ncbi:MAG: acetyl-CoA C-acyltransferase [Planctomycetota bacterium]|jgi:acetyl-CoA acetyltransferase family protein|nr:MAG: acetyl-CoA C-acyltransferase [Planctomycetota bacterium]
MQKDLVIVGGARTAMAEYVGSPGYGLFKNTSALELGAVAAKGALHRSGVAPEQIDHVVIGNALQTSADALYGARHVGLKAGIPIEVPALTVNRLCGSGIQAVVSGAQQIICGDAEVVLAGGMENMSQAPHVIRDAREGMRFGRPPQIEDSLFASLMDTHCGFYMAETAENLAKEYGITREAQDEFALRSHQLGAAAVQKGLFADEIVPVTVKKGRQEIVVDTDDHIKPDSTLEGLSKLRAAFGKEGTVTAGNASGIVDGAAVIIITTADRAAAEGWKVCATIRSWGICGVAPETMGFGPVPSIQLACDKAGIKVGDIDYFEINEAFAAQYLACEKALELDRDKCNVNGGALAIGHPLGATGTRLLITLCNQLEREDKHLGMASACIGGGQGIAMLIER